MQYYLGLKLHGVHKKEWAKEGGQRSARYGYLESNQQTRPPLLEVAHRGNIAGVEWFLSHTPARLYGVFGENNKNDKRLIALSKLSGGFDHAVDSWLNTRRKPPLENRFHSSLSDQS